MTRDLLSRWLLFLVAWAGSVRLAGSFPMPPSSSSSRGRRPPPATLLPTDPSRTMAGVRLEAKKPDTGDDEEEEFYPVRNAAARRFESLQQRAQAERSDAPRNDNNNNNQAAEDEIGLPTASSTTNYMDDLTPPPINWARDSILFSENPATRRNNAGVKAWEFCSEKLPPVLTGVWPWRDPQITASNPLGALYNMLVVRLPTVAVGIVYAKNLVEGHPLIMDVGRGPFEMSPLVVFFVLAIILA